LLDGGCDGPVSARRACGGNLASAPRRCVATDGAGEPGRRGARCGRACLALSAVLVLAFGCSGGAGERDAVRGHRPVQWRPNTASLARGVVSQATRRSVPSRPLRARPPVGDRRICFVSRGFVSSAGGICFRRCSHLREMGRHRSAARAICGFFLAQKSRLQAQHRGGHDGERNSGLDAAPRAAPHPPNPQAGISGACSGALGVRQLLGLTRRGRWSSTRGDRHARHRAGQPSSRQDWGPARRWRGCLVAALVPGRSWTAWSVGSSRAAPRRPARSSWPRSCRASSWRQTSRPSPLRSSPRRAMGSSRSATGSRSGPLRRRKELTGLRAHRARSSTLATGRLANQYRRLDRQSGCDRPCSGAAGRTRRGHDRNGAYERDRRGQAAELDGPRE